MKSFTARIGLGNSSAKKDSQKLPTIATGAGLAKGSVGSPGPASPKSPMPTRSTAAVRRPGEASSSPTSDMPPMRPEPQKWIVGKQYPVVPGELFYMSIRNEEKLKELQEWQKQNGVNVDRVFFTADGELQYFPFCADFGPMNFGMTYRFITMINQKLDEARRQGKKVVFYTSADPAERTNAATLMCAYLVIDRGWTPEDAVAPLTFTGKQPFVGFRDASFQPPHFELSILDVMKGLSKAKRNGLIDMKNFDLEFYEYCDHPAMADLHEIVKGKFVALKGPHTRSYFKDGVQFLAPSHYFELFRKLNVTAVVRLNDEQYPAKAFTDAGFNHYDIYFDDCTVPDRALVDHWFDVCRKEKGAIAIHCKAGLGRTGTLICLWMMRKWKFTGRECIGYIRVMRPGSILGPQQEYLVEMEQEMWALGDPDIAPSRTQRTLAASGGKRLSAAEEAREKEAARIRAKENTDAMNRRAAQMHAAGGGAKGASRR